MSEISNDDAIFVVLLERGMQRLHRAQKIKQRIDAGGLLTDADADIDFLEEVMRTAQENAGLIKRNPEWHEMYGKSVRIYKEITEKALENEKAQKP